MKLKFYIGVLGLMAFSAASYGSVLLQDNFDSYATGEFNNLATLGGNWTVNGTIDVVGPGYYGYLAVGSESGNVIDLNGSTPGGLTSLSIALAPGDYTLTFDLNGSQRGVSTSTTVTLGSLVNATILQNSADVSNQVFSFTVLSATNANLVFASNTPGGIGSLLDNVLLQTGSIPEPSTFALLLGACPLLWAVRKRLVRQ